MPEAWSRAAGYLQRFGLAERVDEPCGSYSNPVNPEVYWRKATASGVSWGSRQASARSSASMSLAAQLSPGNCGTGSSPPERARGWPTS